MKACEATRRIVFFAHSFQPIKFQSEGDSFLNFSQPVLQFCAAVGAWTIFFSRLACSSLPHKPQVRFVQRWHFRWTELVADQQNQTFQWTGSSQRQTTCVCFARGGVIQALFRFKQTNQHLGSGSRCFGYLVCLGGEGVLWSQSHTTDRLGFMFDATCKQMKGFRIERLLDRQKL